jgi:anti-anti-sigma regulatory factor
MTQAATIECRFCQNVPVLAAPSYFDDKIGAQVIQQAADLFQKGHTSFIVDLQNCKIVNSRGLSALLDLAMRCTDDYRGRLAIVNTDLAKKNLFDLIGLTTLILLTATPEEAATQIAKA